MAKQQTGKFILFTSMRTSNSNDRKNQPIVVNQRYGSTFHS